MLQVDSHCKFRRQYLLGSGSARIPSGWQSFEFVFGIQVHAHPESRISAASTGKNSVMCIGIAQDATNYHLGPQDVVARLCEARSFSEIEDQLAILGGRWLMLVRLGKELRLYPDASAQMPIFFTRTGDGVWAGSQPGLLQESLGLATNEELLERFNSHTQGPSWPGGVAPVRGVEQLWPNHWLDLNSGAAKRFWPQRPIQPLDVDEAAHRIAGYLEQIMRGAARLAPLQLWLTGGYDSRVLFSVSKPLHGEMHFCVLDNYKNARYDRSISRRLAKRSGRTAESIRLKKTTPEFWELIRVNTSGMSLEAMNFVNSSSDESPADRLHLMGYAGEVGRCFYYKNGDRPETIDAATLCKLTYFDDNPVAYEVFEGWLRDVGELNIGSLGIDVLDLLYWEHRLGAWAGVQSLVSDTFREYLVPFNCRVIFETMLGTATEYRIEPYLLFRRICELTYPETLDEPFNWSRTSVIADRVTAFIPWRIRNLADRMMARRWGAEPGQ